MNFSNEPLDVMGIITLFLPIVTFVMGYYLTGIEHKREMKLRIIREKFEKLYHPFYVMINELGTNMEEGIAFSVGDGSVLMPFFDHLTANVYLASAEGQKLFWETRNLFFRLSAEHGTISAENERLLEQSIAALFQQLLQEYIKSATALGYELAGMDANAKMTEIRE